MCTSGAIGGGAPIHISTTLWMVLQILPPPLRPRFGRFTTPTSTRSDVPQSSTGMSTLVDNSTVVIYEKACEPVENDVNTRLRRDPRGIGRCCAQGCPQGVDDVDSFNGPSATPVTENRAESIHKSPQPLIHIHPQITPLIHSFLWMDTTLVAGVQIAKTPGLMSEMGGHATS